MNAISTITALVAAMTVYVIVQAIVTHAQTKDAIKLNEAKLRAEEARKSAEEIEKETQAVKAKLASTLSTLTDEQLAAYNRTLEEMRRPVVQYIPVPQFCPYNYGLQAWRGW